MKANKILLGLVGIIGLYMIFAFWGVTAPMLSGLAFVLLAIHDWIE